MPLAAVSIDLDEVHHYFAIHGLGLPSRESRPIYERGLARAERFASDHDLAFTLFAVGNDARQAQCAERLREFARSGHEVANHTLDHRYDFSRLSRDEMRHQVAEATRLLEQTTGSAVTGFRAPGYVVNEQVYDVLGELGMAYSSSVFPCPAYYAAKLTVFAWQRLTRRRSASIADAPRVLLAPRSPYRIGARYHRRGNGIWELPVQVTRGLRLPFIGTALTLAGAAGARLLTRFVRRCPFVNLELHGIDFLDRADDPQLAALAPYQPDLRIDAEAKIEALSSAINALKQAGFTFVRLDRAVERLAKA